MLFCLRMEAILVLLLNNLAPDSVPAKPLAQAILQVSTKYNLDPEELTRVLLVESKGRPYAYNTRSADWGIMQINETTLMSNKWTYKCALNWRCNLELGAKVLSKTNRTCRYNVGTGALTGKRLKACLRYERKLEDL